MNVADNQGDTLLVIARNAIAAQLGEAGIEYCTDDWLRTPAATFVWE